jgi:hypothetical protein
LGPVVLVERVTLGPAQRGHKAFWTKLFPKVAVVGLPLLLMTTKMAVRVAVAQTLTTQTE